MENIQDTKGKTMQRKPKNGDLFDRGTRYNFELVVLKAHRQQQFITILHGTDGRPADCGLAIDYPRLTGGGMAFNGELGKRVKVWKVVGT